MSFDNVISISELVGQRIEKEYHKAQRQQRKEMEYLDTLRLHEKADEEDMDNLLDTYDRPYLLLEVCPVEEILLRRRDFLEQGFDFFKASIWDEDDRRVPSGYVALYGAIDTRNVEDKYSFS